MARGGGSCLFAAARGFSASLCIAVAGGGRGGAGSGRWPLGSPPFVSCLLVSSRGPFCSWCGAVPAAVSWLACSSCSVVASLCRCRACCPLARARSFVLRPAAGAVHLACLGVLCALVLAFFSRPRLVCVRGRPVGRRGWRRPGGGRWLLGASAVTPPPCGLCFCRGSVSVSVARRTLSLVSSFLVALARARVAELCGFGSSARRRGVSVRLALVRRAGPTAGVLCSAGGGRVRGPVSCVLSGGRGGGAGARPWRFCWRSFCSFVTGRSRGPPRYFSVCRDSSWPWAGAVRRPGRPWAAAVARLSPTGPVAACCCSPVLSVLAAAWAVRAVLCSLLCVLGSSSPYLCRRRVARTLRCGRSFRRLGGGRDLFDGLRCARAGRRVCATSALRPRACAGTAAVVLCSCCPAAVLRFRILPG